MAAPEPDWVEADGVCLRYALSGAGPEIMVLVHEMGGCIESWDEIAPALEAEARVLRYDQRGFGLSEKTAEITVEAMVADLAGLLDALAISEPVTLVGAALGAALCLAFALAHPERVKRLALSSPATGGMTAHAAEAMEGRALKVRAGGWREVSDAMFAVTYPPELAADRDRYERHRRRWLTMPTESFIAVNRLMAALDLTADLPRIACETLVIGCAFDRIRPPARSAELAALIPGARYVEIASGHYAPIQTPQLFAAQILALLRAPDGV